jgi:hypothetical protein
VQNASNVPAGTLSRIFKQCALMFRPEHWSESPSVFPVEHPDRFGSNVLAQNMSLSVPGGTLVRLWRGRIAANGRHSPLRLLQYRYSLYLQSM